MQNKQKHNDLVNELEKTQLELEKRRKLLKSITSEEFLSQMAENCATTAGSNASSGILGRKPGSLRFRDKDAIVAVLSKDLGSLIGDSSLTEDEKQARQLEALRVQGKDQDVAIIEKLSALSQSSEEEDTEQWVVDADGKTTVKKSVFRI